MHVICIHTYYSIYAYCLCIYCKCIFMQIWAVVSKILKFIICLLVDISYYENNWMHICQKVHGKWNPKIAFSEKKKLEWHSMFCHCVQYGVRSWAWCFTSDTTPCFVPWQPQIMAQVFFAQLPPMQMPWMKLLTST